MPAIVIPIAYAYNACWHGQQTIALNFTFNAMTLNAMILIFISELVKMEVL